MMKRFISLLVLTALIINLFQITVFAGNQTKELYLEYDQNVYKYDSRLVTVVINEKEIKTGDMPAVIIGNRTLVPVREIFESDAIGAKVEWNGKTEEVYITYRDQFIVLAINDKTAYVNGKPHELDVPAKLVRDLNKDHPKTMIPLRFVSEVLGFEVDWDNSSYTAMLTNADLVVDMPKEPEVPEVTEPETNIIDGEKLEGITGEGANKTLPTELKNTPVHWSATKEQMEAISSNKDSIALTAENHPETRISDISYDTSGSMNRFVIKATSAISEVKYTLWDKKLVIDISSSVSGLPSEKKYDSNPILTSIRSSQYSTNPNATRIVFDLKNESIKLDVAFNKNRTEILVTTSENNIHDILLGQNNQGDFISVKGVAAPDVNIFRLSNPDRVVIDFANTTSLLGTKESEASGQYVEKIRTAQFEATKTRIVVETDGQADYEVVKSTGDETMIQFREPTYENIEYKNETKPVIALEHVDVAIDMDGIIYENDYRNKTFYITLAGNYGNVFGKGSVKVHDGLIETIDISQNSKDQTQIIIKSNTIYEYRIEEVGDRIEIKAYRPRELFDKIVVIDAGHGGRDPGAVANGLLEKDVNLKMLLYLKNHLDADTNIKVYYTRLTDTFPSLQERCDLANEVGADFFVSIHNNAFNASHNGTETLYFPSSAQNKLTSPKLAQIFQKNIVAYTGMMDRGLKQRENLYLLKNTSMPAILVEVGFLTNVGDAAKLKDENFLKTSGAALYQSILETFETYPTKR
ncbi:N-acetylmuramoyl-L-alanine amidase [Petrocella sp. FN5]|uniref:N-acetylmuramoyl-L-alanine amidase n=1 Tax=Petrocella sp. FN5 TaxID=3032002 RepID=UPI0023DB48A8|nr:N-acetylmuramoyl-L-alanine amidase [Petrocella sp. FN5]MDF1617355.1 N-acetylmuramoyl-L-alanine amidase [Petrocella sp. FN5]